MAWKPDIELLRHYISVMTNEQFDKLEDITLGIKDESIFTMREVRDLEIKLQEKPAKDRKGN